MELQGELDLAMIWLKTKPPTVIFMDTRSMFGAPCVFPECFASTREGTGMGKGEDRLNPLSSSVDLY